MKNKEGNSNKNHLIIPDKVIINKKEDYITFNVNKPLTKISYQINTDIFIPKYNNTISYIKPKNLKFFSEDLDKNVLLKKQQIHRKTKIEFLSDKIIQTPEDFYLTSKRTFINKSHPHLNNRIKMVKINYKVFPNKDIINNKNKNKRNVFSVQSKSMRTKHSFLKYLYFNNITKSRNKLSPILNYKKIIAYKNKKIFFHSNNNDIFPVSENRQHKNLLSMENIYLEGKKKYNLNTKANTGIQNGNNIKRIKISSIKSKLSIKEIKYPLLNNKDRKIKIINERNEHLLEKIYKNQTVSNFNNKYHIKYKTNDENKKENIKNLFFLLNKFKNSDKDKKNVFLFYKKINLNNKNNK